MTVLDRHETARHRVSIALRQRPGHLDGAPEWQNTARFNSDLFESLDPERKHEAYSRILDDEDRGVSQLLGNIGANFSNVSANNDR